MTLLAALAGALAISFSGIFFGLSGVDPITGAFFRVAYALPVLFVIWFLFRDRDHRTWQKRLLAFGSGFLMGVDMVVWHTAIGSHRGRAGHTHRQFPGGVRGDRRLADPR